MADWDSLWVGANIATMDDNGKPYGEIRKGGIGVKDGKIAWVGEIKELGETYHEKADKVHLVAGFWITPSLIDPHTHIIYEGNRADDFEQRLLGKSYEEIQAAGGGIYSTVNATRAAEGTDLMNRTVTRLSFLATEGVTTIEIKSGYGLDHANERKMLKVARHLAKSFPMDIVVTLLAAHVVPEEYKDKPDEYVDFICDTLIPEVAKEKLADAVDVFCEKIAYTPAQTEKIFKAAKANGLPIKVHAEQLSHTGGAKLAAKYGALSADHLEYATEADVKAMAKAGTTAVLLPGSYYYLQQDQKPPIDLFRKHKVPMAIGTNSNPGTSPCVSLLAMANMACVLFGLTPEEALAGVTKNAAKALGMEDEIGTLTVGKRANFVVWGMNTPARLSYTIGDIPCDRVIRDGKITFSQTEE
jgi:imidazolonepropionase